MKRDFESDFKSWAAPPGTSEEQRSENAIKAIKDAIRKSPKLNNRSICVFVQGSYRNRVNVRQNSDVDVGVMMHDSFLTHYPNGMTREDFGNIKADYTYSHFKQDLEDALVAHFGRNSVHRGNKAFDIKENTYRVEADVVPLFEYRHYWEDKTFRCGVGLIPDRGGLIKNYPERILETWPRINQHYENGVQKNSDTSRRYKSIVRILKKLRYEMIDYGDKNAENVPGFLIECMVWNVPNNRFQGTDWEGIAKSVVSYLWSGTKDKESCKEWTEVNNFKYLFHPSQSWTREAAHQFIDCLWSYIGVT